MVSKEIENLTPKELKEVQSVLRLLHILGLSNEQIEKLPEVLSLWPRVVNNMNKMAEDLFEVKSEVARMVKEKAPLPDISADTDENIRSSIGFGSSPELTLFGGGRK